jgi:hypothetical protein
MGFSKPAAQSYARQSYARMTAVSVDEGYEMPANPEFGSVSLQQYIPELVKRGRIDFRHRPGSQTLGFAASSPGQARSPTRALMRRISSSVPQPK